MSVGREGDVSRHDALPCTTLLAPRREDRARFARMREALELELLELEEGSTLRYAVR